MQHLKITCMVSKDVRLLLVRHPEGVTVIMTVASRGSSFYSKHDVLVPQHDLPVILSYLDQEQRYMPALWVKCARSRVFVVRCISIESRQQKWGFYLALSNSPNEPTVLLSNRDANRLHKFLEQCQNPESRRRKIRASNKAVFGLS